MSSAGPTRLWSPDPERASTSALRAFWTAAEQRAGRAFPTYADLHRWSVDAPESFWTLLWAELNIQAESPPTQVVDDPADVAASTWFAGARMNPVATLLRRRDASPAIVYLSELGDRRVLSWADLHAQVAAVSAWLRARGVGVGDRVVAVCSNVPEAMVGLLATAAVGGIWSLCSPEYGAQGIVDRFGQLEPVVLLGGSAHSYKGRSFDDLPLVREVVDALPTVRDVLLLTEPPSRRPGETSLPAVLAAGAGAPLELHLHRFDLPGAVLFSSGTTGPPKCIVHSLSAVVLQLLKEHVLHYDLRPGEAFYYHTSTSWNMWYWLVVALAAEAVVVLRDGSPFFPGDDALLQLAAREEVGIFGISPRYLAVLGDRKVQAGPLPKLHTVLSTGSPLPGEGFDVVHQQLKADVRVSSISGGTEIMTCFATGNPLLPVWRGELQCLALGMDAAVYDDDGRTIDCEKGELVCLRAFPSHPVGFWKDPDGRLYHDAYFARFDGVWHHGDFAETTEHGGMVIHGRSDATLKPGGIRVGTGELYPRVESFAEIDDSLVSGIDTADGNVEVVLFVQLKPGARLEASLVDAIRRRIRRETSPWHVPARILPVPDVPYTKTGKKAEIAVRRHINGTAVPNRSVLRNPEALDGFPVFAGSEAS